MSGGGGGGSSRVADYFMSVHYAVASTVDRVNGIFVGDKNIGTPALSENTTQVVDLAVNLFGGPTKQGGLGGYIDFMFGREDQVAPATLAARLGRAPSDCPGFRGITSLFFHSGVSAAFSGVPGFYWSSNVPSLPAVEVDVTRVPVGPDGEKDYGGNGQANPADIIYECLTNTDWGMGTPAGLLDLTTFRNCRDTLAAEGFYMSLVWARSDVIENFVGEILDHIQATLGPDPRNGKFSLRLLRQDYDRDNLPILHPGNSTILKMQRKLWGETANEITVTWTNPESEEEEALTVHDDANIAIQGQSVTTSRNYYGVRNANLARQLAMRDLRQSAAPLVAIEIEVDRTAWATMPGDVVEVRWPEYGIASLLMRVGDVSYGKPGDSKIKTNLLEDIFSQGTSIFVPIVQPKPGDPAPVYPPPLPGSSPVPVIPEPIPNPPQPPEWIDPTEQPRPLDYAMLTTAPYFLVARALGDAGVSTISYPAVNTLALASQSGGDTYGIGLWAETVDTVGNRVFTLIKSMLNILRGPVAAFMPAEAVTTIEINYSSGLGSPIAGQMIYLYNPDTPDVTEMAAIETVVTNRILTLRRGALDTVPHAWVAGTIAWIFDASAASFDATMRADGQEVDYKFTPVTSGGALAESEASEMAVTLTDRPYLPYRPANLKVNGAAWWNDVSADGDPVTITWARRNRISETGQILRWTDADVAPEENQITRLTFVGQDTTEIVERPGTEFVASTAFLNDLGLPATVTIESERDGFVSMSSIVRTITE